MALIQSATTSTDILTIDPTFKAARTIPSQPEMTGAYRTAAYSGSIAAATAAGSVLYTFRNLGPTLAVVRKISVGLIINTAYITASVPLSIAGYAVRGSSWTVQGNVNVSNTASTNLGPFTLNNSGKLKTNYQASNVRQFICTTTGITGDLGQDQVVGLGATTGEDITPFASIPFTNPLAAAAAGSTTLATGIMALPNGSQGPTGMMQGGNGLLELLPTTYGGQPLVFGQNEGFRLKNVQAFGATTGTSILVVNVEWYECNTY